MTCQTARALRQAATNWVASDTDAMVVEVVAIKGSTPRNTGARMLVSHEHVLGTIGGGHLEWQAIAIARQALLECMTPAQAHHTNWQQDFALGPTLGQCCGGALTLAFRWLTVEEISNWPQPAARFHLELHGAGHVGQAIMSLLRDLDCTVRWIDERGDMDDGSAPGFPDSATLQALPSHIEWLPTDAADQEVADAPAGAFYLVLTHRHDLDLRIVKAILKRGDAAFVGLIGSQTKRAQFRRRLAEQGFADEVINTMVCPIGLPGIEGKEPMVIAVSVLAQLLQESAKERP